MKIKAILNYFDKELQKSIVAGEEYEVSKERGEVIISNGYAEEVKEKKEEEPKKVEKEEKPVKKTKK